MEVLLNALWLLLTAAAIGYWLTRSGGRQRNQTTVRGLLVVACVLALLFPVISITDDLVAQGMLEDLGSAPSKAFQKATDPGSTPDPQQVVVAALLSLPQHPVWQVLAYLPMEAPAALYLHSASRQTGRSPPCFC